MRKLALACAAILAALLVGFSQPAYAGPPTGGSARPADFEVHFKPSAGTASPQSWGGCLGYDILEENSPRVIGYGAYANCSEPVEFALTAELQECDPICFVFHTKASVRNAGVTPTPFVSSQYVCSSTGTRTWRVKITGQIRGIAVNEISDEESLPCAT